MKSSLLSMLVLCFSQSVTAQQLYYLSDIPANPNFGVALQDSHLFVIKNFSVSAYNIAQPASPSFVAAVSPQSWPFSLFADGNHLYCGGGMMGQFTVVDISQPANMSIVHEDPSITGTVYQFAKLPPYLYFTSNQDTLFTMDISNPAAPITLGRMSIGQIFTEGSVVAGNHLFLGSTGGLLAFDLSNPAQPLFQSVYTGSFRQLFYNPLQQQLFALQQSGNIAVYDATQTAALALQYLIPANASSITVTNNRIAALTNSGGVTLWEAGTNSAVTLGQFTTPSPGGQQIAIAMQDSLIAYTTVNSTFLLKYGFVNPAGLPESTESRNGILVFHSGDNTVRWSDKAPNRRDIASICFIDGAGRIVQENIFKEIYSIKEGEHPLLYTITLRTGQVWRGKLSRRN
jgi:hypothetical protein